MDYRGLGLVAVMSAAVLAGGAVGCSSKKGYVKGGEIERTIDQQQVGKEFIDAMGIGGGDPTMTNQTQKMATSRNAAIVAAQHELLSLIKGTRLQGGITVEKAIETDSRLQTSLDEVIKGAEITKTEWTKDDGCVVSMRVSKKRLEKMMGVKFE